MTDELEEFPFANRLVLDRWGVTKVLTDEGCRFSS